jgi:oligosaccharyltransferase complex subunit alpha (ribophorin I)
MKTLAVFSAVLSLLACATASPDTNGSSRIALPSTFKPPQVFRNANLVHVISVEKNYAKENINVLIENVDKQEQDEYFIPFTSDQMSRIGGVEVKDRKDANVGPFTVEIVEFDPTR